MTRSRQAAEHFAPGEYLAEILQGRCLTECDMANATSFTLSRIHGIIYHEHVFTKAEAKLLAEYLDTSVELWLNLQAAYLDAACREAAQEQPQRGGKG